jgi:hypothetical protein
VNGRALVNGLRLADMPAPDMLDVLHYFFEDDLNFSTPEQAEAREKTRSSIYQELYNSTYKYASNGKDFIGEGVDEPEDDSGEEEEINPFTVKEKAKSFIKPTEFNPEAENPFGKLLDGPMA